MTHRIVFDMDGDGLYNGTDDWDSGELVAECDNAATNGSDNESGDDCEFTFMVWFNGTWGVGEYNYQDMLSDGTVQNGTIVVTEDVHVENSTARPLEVRLERLKIEMLIRKTMKQTTQMKHDGCFCLSAGVGSWCTRVARYLAASFGLRIVSSRCSQRVQIAHSSSTKSSTQSLSPTTHADDQSGPQGWFPFRGSRCNHLGEAPMNSKCLSSLLASYSSMVRPTPKLIHTSWRAFMDGLSESLLDEVR